MFQMGWGRPLHVHPLPGHPRGSVAPHGKHANGTREAKRDKMEEGERGS